MTRFLVTAAEVTLSVAEEIVGEPAHKWEGRCYEIASLIADHVKHADAVYGHYSGPVDPCGYWGERCDDDFIQHGWVVIKGSSMVLDPTRFSFENVDPYVYFGPADHYDEGGNDYRSKYTSPCPPFDFSDGVVPFPEASANSALSRHLDSLVPGAVLEDYVTISKPQAFWLANIHYCRLEPFAKEIYAALHRADLRAFIPQDNWKRAFRDGSS